MLKDLIQSWTFKNKLYPEFIKQINNAFKENKAVFLYESSDDYMQLDVIIGNSLMKFNKVKHGQLSYEKITISEKLEVMLEQNKDNLQYVSQLKFFINDIKINGQTTSSSHIIDYLNTTFKGAIPYYRFTRKEVAYIYERIISDHHYFFTYNHGATMLNISANKWLD